MVSAPPRAPTIFLASRSFAILSLAVAILSLTTISFVPYAQQIDLYSRLTAAATRCTFTVPGLSPFEPDTAAPITTFILALIDQPPLTEAADGRLCAYGPREEAKSRWILFLSPRGGDRLIIKSKNGILRNFSGTRGYRQVLRYRQKTALLDSSRIIVPVPLSWVLPSSLPRRHRGTIWALRSHGEPHTFVQGLLRPK